MIMNKFMKLFKNIFDFVKNNWFKLGILLVSIIIALSIFYCLVFYIPQTIKPNNFSASVIKNEDMSDDKNIESSQPQETPEEISESPKETAKPVIQSEQTNQVVKQDQPVSTTQMNQSNIQISDLSPLTVYGNDKKNFYTSTYTLDSMIKIPFYTFKKVVIRKIQIELVRSYFGPDLDAAFSVNIQGTSFELQQNGNYLVWEGYKEINGLSNLFSVSFLLNSKYCFWYKIDSNSFSLFERVEYDTQNVFQNSYSEYPITLTGDFPFISQKACNDQAYINNNQ